MSLMNNDEIIINNEVSLFAQASKFYRRHLIISNIRRFRRATAQQFESLLIKFEWQTYLIPLRDDDMGGDVRNVGAHPFAARF